MFSLEKIQEQLRIFGFDAWLLFDFRCSNPLARRVLGIADDVFLSRRWFYMIPSHGKPVKICHKIEPGALNGLPGEIIIYLAWQELHEAIEKSLIGRKKIAMEYSPHNAIPYLSRVDAGTVELVRSFGVEVEGSGDLVQVFESCLSPEQWQLHLKASQVTRSAYDVAFGAIASSVRGKKGIRESDVIQLIMSHFEKNGLYTDHSPICGVNEHSADPHYSTRPETDSQIREGDFVLIDLWAKMNAPQGIYSDLTRTGYVGNVVPAKYAKIFDIVAHARDAGIAKVRESFSAGKQLEGWEVDQVVRDVICKSGYGEQFCHRTGHSIGKETHGNGANLDGLETRDNRKILPGSLFSIEPGIYLPGEFGVRSETNIFVGFDGQVHVTGGDLQTEILPILGV
jgi:Xaa-Pro aminopeptidase